MNRSQDIKIVPDNLQEVNGSYDGLRSSLNIFLHLKLRRPSPDTEFDILYINAKLKLNNSNTHLSDTIIPFGESAPRDDYETGAHCKFILDDKALNIIENKRNGDVVFVIELIPVIIIKQIKILTNGDKLVESMRTNTLDKIIFQFSIPKSHWVEKILKNLGLPGFKLIEIPLSHSNLSEAYDNIISEFNKAEYYFSLHDYNKCISHCRGTMDALTRSLKAIKANTDSKSSFKWFNTVDTATLSWIDEMNKSTSAISSITHHSDSNKEFSRHEAHSIYLITLGLMNFIGHTNNS